MGDQNIVDTYAALLRDRYSSLRNRWTWENEGVKADWGQNPIPRYDGGVDGQGRRHQSVWKKMARWLIDHQVSPSRFIEAQFRGRAGAPPEPNTLCSDAALNRFYAFEGEEVPELKRLLSAQKDTLFTQVCKKAGLRQQGWTDAQVYSEVLQNNLIPLSALFRYAVAVQQGCPEVADLYRTEAAIQYLSAPRAYDQVWGKLVPPEVAALARLTPDQLSSVSLEEEPLDSRPASRPARALFVD